METNGKISHQSTKKISSLSGLLSIFLLLYIAYNNVAIAQQNPVFSQYMFNGLAINPAYAGNQDQFSATALYRKQWDNFQGAPSTQTLSAHSSVKNKNIGVGLLAARDQIGIHNDTRVYLSYAYKIKMRVGTLAMGVQGGFNNLYSDYTQLNLKSEKDVLMTGTSNSFNPNFGTGLFYSTQTAYAGFSIPYIVNGKLKRASDVIEQGKQARYYFLTAGKVFTLNHNLKFKPSTLLRIQEGNATNVDINASLILDDIITVGVSYRSNDAVVGMFEMELTDKLRFGYAYDYTTSDIGQYANGSHEFMVNFRIPQHHKCHTYF
jgi:type IX secretion system PorP/SprF family membrane protein